MINVNIIIDDLISRVGTDLSETKREIRQLESEVKAYETVIKRLEELKHNM